MDSGGHDGGGTHVMDSGGHDGGGTHVELDVASLLALGADKDAVLASAKALAALAAGEAYLNASMRFGQRHQELKQKLEAIGLGLIQEAANAGRIRF
ncbi:hypothetical protein [Rudaea sp.]|uniref:hypothetical protein n=1 Tax=Rudaea sp. TaxID=2136325 RepID=UPI003784958B